MRTRFHALIVPEQLGSFSPPSVQTKPSETSKVSWRHTYMKGYMRRMGSAEAGHHLTAKILHAYQAREGTVE
ncbi:hypothetical protein CPY51_30400 [Rhizobium tubonense]|uniref:Uncharacterized protein n=1 Tax=Rhizobium tubonense TaxID=484088 RepID=A0A2W4C3J0_9HYPH|nr:hypothetical protein CPY51_30400 [Rhizobium tubonense]